jgi:hypothetical protein
MNKLGIAILQRTTTTIFALIIALMGWAQDGNKIYDVSKTRVVDQSNYEEIRGTPYLYEDWHAAKLLDTEGKYHDFSEVNFNGYTHELESKNDGLVEEFIGHAYLKIIVNTGKNEDTFIRGIHPDFGRKIVCILYDGQEVKFIKEYSVKLEEAVMQTPGIPTVFEKFSPNKNYYLMVDSNLTKTKLKKKSIIEILGYKTEIEKYLKQEKINVSSEDGLIRLLNYYESLI